MFVVAKDIGFDDPYLILINLLLSLLMEYLLCNLLSYYVVIPVIFLIQFDVMISLNWTILNVLFVELAQINEVEFESR